MFEPTQTLVLVTDDSEGVVVGMDMTFSGFPIGRVRRVALAETGNVHIVIDVPRKDAHWLRTTSIFTLVRGLVGGTNIRAFTGILTDPPLPDGAQRPVLRGDATAELPARARGREGDAGEPQRHHRAGRRAADFAGQRARRHRKTQGPAWRNGRGVRQ